MVEYIIMERIKQLCLGYFSNIMVKHTMVIKQLIKQLMVIRQLMLIIQQQRLIFQLVDVQLIFQRLLK